MGTEYSRDMAMTAAQPEALWAGEQPPAFPLVALVGQPQLQLALLLAAVDPSMGGVLISGPRGTAKSTAARALAALMPEVPFVTLPLSATLEQVVGTLDLEGALRDGRVRFAPGVLARAHEGVLYVDEVNLLADVLVDALLDAAASGVNTVERDGVSHRHPARFVLVGTMNPEEGELRPQLLDRFGLYVAMQNPPDSATRAAIVRQRLAYEADPVGFVQRHAAASASVAQRLRCARERLATVTWDDAILEHVAQCCQAARVDGVRADLVLLKAARAHAAWHGRATVAVDDVEAVQALALAHRCGGSPASGRDPSPPPQSMSASMAAPTSQGGSPAPLDGTAAGHHPAPVRAAPGDVSPGGGDASAGDWGAMEPEPITVPQPALPQWADWWPKKP